MSVPKIIATIIVFLISCIGWFILGTVTTFRSDESFSRLGPKIEALWGTPLIQKAPAFSVQILGTRQVRWIMPSKNEITVEIQPDYTQGSLSPMSTNITKDGMILNWEATDLITNSDIGIIMPQKLNPGPLTSRITYFAPVCLIFFFVLIATINIKYAINIHPMHYLFVAAGFFAFHLLLTYFVGHINVHLAFLISTLTSVTLVTSYLSSSLGKKFPWKIAIVGQLFFLVLFSYSFFIRGITGLTVAIGSVVTLAILMRVTVSVDWNKVFVKPVKISKTARQTVLKTDGPPPL
jgi:inner membrane protein involved in colicin E2 resistance